LISLSICLGYLPQKPLLALQNPLFMPQKPLFVIHYLLFVSALGFHMNASNTPRK